jgi:hypothetical protein
MEKAETITSTRHDRNKPVMAQPKLNAIGEGGAHAAGVNSGLL